MVNGMINNIFLITRIPSLSPWVIEIPQEFLILDQKLESLIHYVFWRSLCVFLIMVMHVRFHS